jgi:hypothetical protein
MLPDRRIRHNAVNMHFPRLIPTRLEASDTPVTQPKIGTTFTPIHLTTWYMDGSQWPRGLRCGSVAAHLLELWV